MTEHPQDLSLRDQVAALAGGELDPVELLEATLARIAERDGRFNSFAETFPDQSRRMALDAEGALHGAPIGVKDMFALPWRGYRNGTSRALSAPSSSTVFERLEARGAVVAGITNQHWMGMGTTGTVSAYGPCANPWSPSHCAGGSSGGSAAAVAGRLVAGSIGSDSGGSTRLPAAYCGVLGLKVTFRSMPYDGYTGASMTLSAPGTFARDGEDLRLLTECLLNRPLPRSDGSGLRVGLVEDPFWSDIDADVEARCRAALDAAGWSTSRIDLEGATLLQTAATVRISSEAAAAFPPALIAEAEPMTRGLLHHALTLQSRLLVRADRVRAQVRRSLAAAFDDVDVVAWPTVPAPAPPLDDPWVTLPSGRQLADVANLRPALAANFTGVPGISIPVGRHRSGLPVGLQLLAPWGGEATLLDAASHLEAATAREYVDMRPESVG